MTLRARTARRPQVSLKPRLTWRAWDNEGASVLIPGAQTIVDLTTAGNWPSLVNLGVIGDYTVRRVRGELTCQALVGVETNQAEQLTWGLFIAEADAVAASVVPEADNDAADWFGYGVVFMDAQGSFSAGIHPSRFAVIDSKSMRKVNENHQRLVLVIDASGNNIGNVGVHTAGRFLVSHGRR